MRASPIVGSSKYQLGVRYVACLHSTLRKRAIPTTTTAPGSPPWPLSGSTVGYIGVYRGLYCGRDS
eukprot:1252660-Lingulodinium_polyedra.AAC.1